ncbi:MAG: hypothetical protein COY80_01035 [Candidatus Pacebacteria bacterium CG_4_10_14_0_8_um_filter_42_14]|nr:MAG: hypothetical protein COY80_01035 [Candidatus Pacebacteria bacterium CG_4_10_14_0_8_um_filter_42_14]
MNAILVARVSTEEQKDAGNSLPAQEHRIDQYFKRKDFPIIQRFSFDESAFKDRRDDFDKVLAFIATCKEPTAVGFDKVDRLSRNVFDKRVSDLYEQAVDGKIELHFVSDGQVIHKDISAVEKFQFGINLGLAKYYSDAISDSVKRAIEQKLRVGEWPSKAPYGYENYRVNDDKTEIKVDEYKAAIIKKVYEWYASGAYSMDSVRAKLKEVYDISWSKGYLDKILKNPFYYGVMLWKEKSYAHKVSPTIEQAPF